VVAARRAHIRERSSKDEASPSPLLQSDESSRFIRSRVPAERKRGGQHMMGRDASTKLKEVEIVTDVQ